MGKIALIPAAGRGSRMLSLTDSNPKAMLPLKNKPIIGHQLDFMIDNNFDKVIIVVGYKKEKLIKYVSDNYASKISIVFVEQAKLDGLADAVLTGINSLSTEEKILDKLLVSLGDIVPFFNYGEIDLKADGRSFVLYNEVEDYSRWCLVDIDCEQNVKEFIDKPSSKPDLEIFRNLVGIYQFDDILTIQNCLEDVIDEGIRINGEFQLSQALEKYSKFIKIKAIHSDDKYYDLGEIDDLNKTRENIARHFNNVSLVDGIIVKTSETNFSKLINEVRWYEKVPKKLSKYVPNFLGVDIENKNYKLEYIKSTPLQELFLYNLPNENEWKKILSSIFDYISKTYIIADESFNLNGANYKMLIEKTDSRIVDVAELFYERYYTINGKIYKNPLFHLEQIYGYVYDMFLSEDRNTVNMCYLHGDLFFGNMMYDIEKEELKILDPRGDYGGSINKGDIRYDVAKLNHSINGYYDFIVNGLYRLDDYGTIMNYVFYDSDKQHEVKQIFETYLQASYFKEDEINLLTGLLFLTMIPLHSDNISNQKMQFIKACEFLEDFIK